MHSSASIPESKLLNQLLELSLDLICLFNQKWEFTLVSKSVSSILGYEPHELLGKHYLEFVHPDDHEASISRSIKTIDREINDHFENRYVHKNGSLVYLQWAVNFDPDTKQFFAVGRDITQIIKEKQAEDAKNKINQALINGTENLVWTVNREFTISGFNKNFAQNIYEDYKIVVQSGMSVFEVSEFTEDIKSYWKSLYQKVFDGEIVEFEYSTEQIKTISRKDRWLKVVLKPIESNNTIIGVIGNSTDITELKIAVNKLAERNKLIEHIISEIPMGIAVNKIDNGKGILINKQFSQIYNWPPQEISTIKKFMSRVYPSDDAAAQNVAQKILSDIKTGDITRMKWDNIPVMGQDGSLRYVNAKNIPLLDQNLMISTVQDNTNTFLNKNALESAYLEKKQILDSLSDAFYTLDTNFNFIFLNKHCLENMSKSAEELIGNNIFEEFPELKNTVFHQHLIQVKQTKNPVEFEFYHEHFQSWFNEKIYKTDDGFSVFFEDITIKKNLRLQLEAAIQKQIEILESITDAFIGLDHNFNFTYVNAEAENVFKIKKEQILGRCLWHIFPEANNKIVLARFNKVIKNKTPISFEYFSVLNDAWFTVNVYPSGSGLSIYFRDITQEKNDEINLVKLNHTLKQKNSELEQFAYVASHDLQEPLRIIVSFMDLLKVQFGDDLDETAKKYIDYSIEGSHRMRQLMMDLLDYSRAGSIEENIKEIDCNVLLHQVITLLEESIKAKNAKITYDALPVLHYNHTALRQVLMNLIGNSLKYMQKDKVPEIHISVEEKDGYFEFKLRDNGIGIEEKYFNKIFTIFKRLHNKSEYSGTGIGLAICKKVIEKYGGEISVSSQIEKGSTFIFTIPKNI